MPIKKIITGGCSFSDSQSEATWVYRLQESYPSIKFRHTGMGSQGNELIQKKISLALIEELDNYAPEELLVIPMWSGTERRAFWIDDPNYVEEISNEWPKRGLSWALQFGDLYGQHKNSKIKETPYHDPAFDKKTVYNVTGGWYHCNYLMPDCKLTDELFRSCSTVIGYATISLENIIFLQNLCKLKNVKIFHTFYRSYVYDDIYQNKDHLNLNYLYKQLDHDKIISTTGIYEHLRPTLEEHQQWDRGGIFKHIYKMGFYTDGTKQYFESDNWHPNIKGSKKWTQEILIPKLNEKGLFNE